MLQPKVVYEDETLWVIDKPAGIVVNRAQSVKEETIQDWAENKLKVKNQKFKVAVENSKYEDFYKRGGIVHRLDKETSGLLIIARNPQSFAKLQAQFKERKIKKKYLALVHGEVKPSKGTVKAPIKRNPFNPKKFGVYPGGRSAETSWRALQTLKSDDRFHLRGGTESQHQSESEALTFLELKPLTGRTHQIRAHLKFLGHPIVSDPLYSGKKTLRADRQFCPRLFLHAAALQFSHPKTGQGFKIESRLPKELEEVLKKLYIVTKNVQNKKS